MLFEKIVFSKIVNSKRASR